MKTTTLCRGIAATGMLLTVLAGLNGTASYAATGEVTPMPAPAGIQHLHIEATCDGSIAVFHVHNEGGRLPGAVQFKLFRSDMDTIISKRRMRMIEGQSATFKVKNADKIPADIALFMDSEWQARPQQADAQISCG